MRADRTPSTWTRSRGARRWVTFVLSVAIALLAITLRATPSYAAMAWIATPPAAANDTHRDVPQEPTTLSGGHGIVEHIVIPSGVQFESARGTDEGTARAFPLTTWPERSRKRSSGVELRAQAGYSVSQTSPTRARAVLMVFLN